MTNLLLYLMTVLIRGTTWIALKLQLGSVQQTRALGNLLSGAMQRLGQTPLQTNAWAMMVGACVIAAWRWSAASRCASSCRCSTSARGSTSRSPAR